LDEARAGVWLVPNAKVNIDNITLNGHLFGGAPNQDFQVTSASNINVPPVESIAIDKQVSVRSQTK